MAGVPQPYVARDQCRAPPDRRDEQRPARRVVAGGHVDDEQRTAHRGPRDEPAPQLPHDLGLAAGGERRSVAHPVDPLGALIEGPPCPPRPPCPPPPSPPPPPPRGRRRRRWR